MMNHSLFSKYVPLSSLYASTHAVPSAWNARFFISTCWNSTVLQGPCQVQSPSWSLSLSCSQMDFFPFHCTNSTYSLYCASNHSFGDILDIQTIIFSHLVDLRLFHWKKKKSINFYSFLIPPWNLTECLIHRVGPELIFAEIKLIF